MAMFKDFTFDGENSKDYGVYISGEAVYDAPDRSMDMVQIPGRNGALALDNGYYNNINVTYPAGCFADDQEDFAAKLSRIRNMLASRHRYCRLEDSYHPDYFRLALYRSGLDVSPVAMNRAGRFNITFDAKPQRFLKTGEEIQALDADEPPTEVYGPADIVTFQGKPGDSIVSSVLSVEPVQDLNGFDAPWPAGGGKNLWSAEATFSKDNTTLYITKACNLAAGTYTLSGIVTAAEGITSVRFSFRSSSPVTAQLPVGGDRTSVTFELADACTQVYIYGQNGTSGQNAATYTDIQVERGSAATSYAPYANICPITGFTGAEITAKGVNLWDEERELGTISNTSGEDIASNASWRSFYISVKPRSNIRVVNNAIYQLRYYWYDINKSFIESSTWASTSQNLVTVPDNAYYLRIRSTGGVADYSNDISINYPSTDNTYHASVGTTRSITWSDEAGTVYGGTLAYLGGDSWRLTKTMESVDMGTLSYTYDTTTLSVPVFYSSNVPSKKLGSDNMYSPWYKTGNSRSYLVDNDFALAPWNSTNSGHIGIRDSRYTDATTFTTAVTGQQLVYELATPVTYQLSPTDISVLLGTNNIFSDTGPVTVTVQSPYELENPTLYPSRPLIRVYGSGTIQVNDVTITVAEHPGYIDIDCDLMDCYMGADNMNQYVSFSGNDFPELVPGINRILLNGPERVEITPRWWEL